MSRRSWHVAALAAGFVVLVSCSPYTESPVTDEPAADVAKQTEQNARLMGERLSTLSLDLEQETTVCTDDPNADSPISYIYEVGVKVDRGRPVDVVAEATRLFESEGWESGRNGTFRNLDRDRYRISLRIDDETPQFALMIASSPCVDERKPD